MITNDLFIETGKICINKHSEMLCGDYYTTFKERDKTVFVLSDGLGSGVKANILATLTATILGTMISKNLPLDECVNAVASTLPMCKERNLAYATFTVLSLDSNHAYLVQYDNPRAIILRKGKSINYPTSVRFIGEKEIHESCIELQENDIILLMTDGVTHSGIGKLAENGWDQEDIIDFLERIYTPDISAPCMAASICNACMTLNMNSADDDITAFAVKMKPRQSVNIMLGPPKKKDEDEKILKLFFAKDGKRVVCGGTTASAVSKYLSVPMAVIPDSGSEEIPAMASIEGVDLVTEGVITLKKVVDICNLFIHDPLILLDLKKRRDGAALLSTLLIEEATDISIYFGTTVNLAHSDTEIDFNTKLTLIKQLEEYLEQMGKRVHLSLC
jgi:serine/threonine protein phosphatase PrpC